MLCWQDLLEAGFKSIHSSTIQMKSVFSKQFLPWPSAHQETPVWWNVQTGVSWLGTPFLLHEVQPKHIGLEPARLLQTRKDWREENQGLESAALNNVSQDLVLSQYLLWCHWPCSARTQHVSHIIHTCMDQDSLLPNNIHLAKPYPIGLSLPGKAFTPSLGTLA